MAYIRSNSSTFEETIARKFLECEALRGKFSLSPEECQISMDENRLGISIGINSPRARQFVAAVSKDIFPSFKPAVSTDGTTARFFYSEPFPISRQYVP